MFYTYEYYIVDTNEIIYVGKGTGNRYKKKKKNILLNRLLKDNKCDVRITHYYETEEEAFEAERLRINELKAIGQAICNKATYSTGGIQSFWNEERRKNMSINNPMKNVNQRIRMSINNPMKNKEIAKSVGEKRRKKVKIDGIIFNGVIEASKYYNVSPTSIKNWQKNGKCEYLKNEEKPKIIENLVNNHKIIYGDKIFKNVKELSLELKHSSSTINRWLRKGFSSNGIVCKYTDDDNEYTYKKPNKTHNNIMISINGIIYNSIKEASYKTGYSAVTIRKYLKCQDKNKKLQCEYANQQPSHTNSDKSSVEGSTTNE